MEQTNKIDKTLAASFPASDPPSWNPQNGVGPLTKKMVTKNPFNDEDLKAYDIHYDTDGIIGDAQKRFLTWRSTSMQERCDHLTELAAILEKKKASIAVLITQEMGKPIKESEQEVLKCATLCRYYADELPAMAAGRNINWSTRAGQKNSQVRYQPLGVILGVMPWNFPFWQVMRFAVPTLGAGNTVLVKHASNVSGCSILLEQLFAEAGFPKHCYQALIIDHESAAEVIKDVRIKGVSMTGSTSGGKEIARLAAGEMKPTLFELGGSDPYIVLADADVEQAADICFKFRTLNAGQSCISAKRFIVDEKVVTQFKSALIKKVKALNVGDPGKESTDIGPMARPELKEKLDDQVKRSVEQGAEIVWQHEIKGSSGNFYPPTILFNPSASSPAYAEELFGPVFVIITARDSTDACRIANDTSFGLGAAIFSKDIDQARYLAQEQIEAGMVSINGGVQSHPAVPFGGIGDSGYGRECSEEGFKSFCNAKVITADAPG